jgi:hypothetical protein
MWIRRRDWSTLRDELIEQRTRAAVLTEQAVSHRTQTAFLIARVNQLEKERAIMVRHITKLEIPVPELTAIPQGPITQSDILSAMGASMFEDMGDHAARQQGVRWNDLGAVEYAAEPQPPKG